MSVHEPSSASVKKDGRRLRSERTRQAIIEAYIKLIRGSASGAMPTAFQIAEEAGCSQRSIFERFSDLDALNLATADYAIEQGQAEAAARNVDGDRPTRIRSHVETRASACEKWLPLWRVLANQDHPELKRRVVVVRSANIECLELMYGPELSLLLEEDRTQLLLALGALTSFESWDLLRHSYGLSVTAAQAVWSSSIDRILPR